MEYMVKKHCIGGLVARPMQRLCHFPTEVGGSTPVQTTTKFYTLEGCHVAAHDWATWHHITCHPMTCVNKLLVHVPCQITCPVSLPTQHLCTVASPCHLPCVGPYHATSTLYRLYSQQNFACLEKWTEHDISLIRCHV
jgi:hypothetical protein